MNALQKLLSEKFPTITRNEAKELLVKLGWEIAGSGISKVVYAKKGVPFVIKIGSTDLSKPERTAYKIGNIAENSFEKIKGVNHLLLEESGGSFCSVNLREHQKITNHFAFQPAVVNTYEKMFFGLLRLDFLTPRQSKKLNYIQRKQYRLSLAIMSDSHEGNFGFLPNGKLVQFDF